MNANGPMDGNDTGPVIVSRVGAVAVVRLNRPRALNAFDPETVVRLSRAWRELRDDGGVKSIVLTGTGERAFCAGGDLKRLIPLLSGQRPAQDEWDEALLRHRHLADDAALKTFDVGRPVIAAINGLAVGGGFELVHATDLRVMSADATFALPEVKRGLFPSGGSTVRLPQQLPHALAMEMLLTGAPMNASEALRLGLINRMVPVAEVMPCALELAQAIAALSPVGVQAIRRSVRMARELPLSKAFTKETELALPVFATAEAASGVRRFADSKKG
jgi:enoyl-CoA hydratase